MNQNSGEMDYKIMKKNTNNHIENLEHCEDVHDLNGLSNYNTKDMKDIKPNETDITFDEVNSYKIHWHRESG